MIGVSVYDGMVPDTVPTMTGGAIKPYLAVWTQPLREHREQSLAYCHPETEGALTVTVAGATVGTVRNLGQATIGALNRVGVPGGGEYVHTEPHVSILFDKQVTPGRFYLPITFRFEQP